MAKQMKKPQPGAKAPCSAVRKCCKTLTGQNNPHAPDCPMMHPPKKQKRGPFARQPRLPTGSRFVAKWTSTGEDTGVWEGQLHIPIPEAQTEMVFHAEAGAVFRLLTRLDEFYRKWVEERQARANVAPDKGGRDATGSN